MSLLSCPVSALRVAFLRSNLFLSSSVRSAYRFTVGALCLFALNAYATDASVDLSSDAIKFKIDTKDVENRLNLAASALLTEDDGDLYAFSAYTYGPVQSLNDVLGGVGLRAYHANVPGDNFQSLGLGGMLEFNIPQVNALSVAFELYYSPSIIASDDIDSVVDISVTAEYQAFENAALYIGARDINVDFGETDGDIHSGVFLGFKLNL